MKSCRDCVYHKPYTDGLEKCQLDDETVHHYIAEICEQYEREGEDTNE